MKKRALISLLNISIILAFCGIASGAEKKRIAVLPFSTKNVPPVAGQVIRDIIEVELISSQIFKVLEREQIGLVLKEQEIHFSVCDETACAIKYGKALSIDYMVIGKVMKLNNYVVSLRLIDVRKNVILSAEKVKSDSIKDLEKAAENLADDFLEQLNTDNPVPRKPKLRPNRFGTIIQAFYFQYSMIPTLRLPDFVLPESYGAPVLYKPGIKNVHAVGGGTSTSVSVCPWLSIRGDISVGYIPVKEFIDQEWGSFSEVGFYTASIIKIRHLFVSTDFFIQLNWQWKNLMPHIALGVGYSYNRSLRDDQYDDRNLSVHSVATDTYDYYSITMKYRNHFLFLISEIGCTYFFNNYIGLTYTFGLRYSPGLAYFKSIILKKGTAEIEDTDPLLDTYKNLDEKILISNGQDHLMLNFRFGIVFRML